MIRINTLQEVWQTAAQRCPCQVRNSTAGGDKKKSPAGAGLTTLCYRPIAKGTTSREPHLEHLHRRASQATVVQGLWSALSSSIAHRCSWSHRLQRAPIVATLRCCWSAARDTSEVSRDFLIHGPTVTGQLLR